jgi:hypothetical protein
MACNLSAGRYEPCKESVGGLTGVYFLNFTTASFTYKTPGDPSSEITAFPSGSYVYYYDLKGNSSYTETVNSSRDNGTTFFSQELTLNLKKLTNEMTTQLKVMAYGRPQIVVNTMSGDSLLVGRSQGADVTAGSIQTGAALGDLYGYSVSFTGLEQLPANFISGSVFGNPFAAMTGNGKPTIVTGSNATNTF